MTSEQDTASNGERPKKRMGRRSATPTVDAPTLGYIPATPATPMPVLADPIGDAARSYRQALDRIQVAKTERVFLVTSADQGLGPTLTSLNLAMAATRIGIRAVVIDGHESGDGPSRFLSTGSDPGLSDIAAGSATLKDASRLIQIDDRHRVPVIAAGSDPEAAFEPASIADEVDLITEHSDLVLISIGAGASTERTVALGAHADGSLLVVDEGKPHAGASEAADMLAEVGAPVIGIIERAAQKRQKGRRR